MAQFRSRLSKAGYAQFDSGAMHGDGQVVKLTYSSGEVTVIVRAGNDHSTTRVERVPSHDLGRLDLLAEAIVSKLPWPVWS